MRLHPCDRQQYPGELLLGASVLSVEDIHCCQQDVREIVSYLIGVLAERRNFTVNILSPEWQQLEPLYYLSTETGTVMLSITVLCCALSYINSLVKLFLVVEVEELHEV